MQIFVRLLDGNTVPILVQEETTLEQLEQQIAVEMGLCLPAVRLISQGIFLENGLVFGQLQELSTVYVTGQLEGGKKKKKKKNYTTKKKNKHKHKRVPKLALSLFKVAGDGKATETHKTCPNCGPGIFLAKHWDRYYCGKCHTTIRLDEATIKANDEARRAKEAKQLAEKKKAEAAAAEAAAAKAAKGKKKVGKDDGKKGKK